jgi:MoxR-like ATPase
MTEEKTIDNNSQVENVLETKVAEASEKLKEVKAEIHKKIVGQDELIDSMVIALLSKGHVLIE